MKNITRLITLLAAVSVTVSGHLSAAEGARSGTTDSWTFVSIPDFLNFDIEYPQEGWEDTLGFVIESMKEEDPAFAMVAGDLVMGHWGTSRESVGKWAEIYYPPWTQRFKDHGLKVYTALGDHEIGDNPWGGKKKAAAVPYYKEAFRKYLNMPLNGPEHMQGTAFYWRHRNALFVSLDVFEKGRGPDGLIEAQVTGAQLKWFEDVLEKYRAEVDHIIVMGHTPILGPVRRYSSSGMRLAGGRDSAVWKLMVDYEVDLYISGEVHAVTCLEDRGIVQVSHGGLFGRTTIPDYMVVTVHPDRLELDIKQIDLVNGKGRLWQQDKRRGPWATLTITEASREEGFTSIGSLTIDKQGGETVFKSPTGFFAPESDPTTAKDWVPERRMK